MVCFFYGDPYGYLPFLASENSRQGIGDKSPRANQRVLRLSRTGHQKAKILKQTVFALGFCCEE